MEGKKKTKEKILYLDCFAGISGDMVLGALIDIGVPLKYILDTLSLLPLQGYRVITKKVKRGAIQTLAVDVLTQGPQPERSYKEIISLLNSSKIKDEICLLAKDIFGLLAEAEAKIHGCSKDKVVFHEIGALDSIIDIVGAACALDFLGAKVICSPVPVGKGIISSCHGFLPVPAPATLEILSKKNIPIYDGGIEGELTTPTGAAIIAATATFSQGFPSFYPLRIGYGAAKRNLNSRPAALRAILGKPYSQNITSSEWILLQTNIDNMNPEFCSYLMELLFSKGAQDVWFAPVQMKKNRPGFVLNVLTKLELLQPISEVIFTESTTLGLRYIPLNRIEIERKIIKVPTSLGEIPIKISKGPQDSRNIAPEFEACRKIAKTYNLPLKEVYHQAILAYLEQNKDSSN